MTKLKTVKFPKAIIQERTIEDVFTENEENEFVNAISMTDLFSKYKAWEEIIFELKNSFIYVEPEIIPELLKDEFKLKCLKSWKMKLWSDFNIWDNLLNLAKWFDYLYFNLKKNFLSSED